MSSNKRNMFSLLANDESENEEHNQQTQEVEKIEYTTIPTLDDIKLNRVRTEETEHTVTEEEFKKEFEHIERDKKLEEIIMKDTKVDTNEMKINQKN